MTLVLSTQLCWSLIYDNIVYNILVECPVHEQLGLNWLLWSTQLIFPLRSGYLTDQSRGLQQGGGSPIRERHHAHNLKLLVVKCQIEGCEYETPGMELVITAALITTHATIHQTPSQPTQTRIEKVAYRWHNWGLAVLQVKVGWLRKGNQAGRDWQSHQTILMLQWATLQGSH